MSEIPHPIIKLLQDDKRYQLDGYQFVREALAYAQDVLGLGGKRDEAEDDEAYEPHLTGQQLCEAIRIYAVEQYGFMTRTVLASWGIHSTSDLGEIVYNMISIGMMKKSPSDCREHFNDVFEFDEVFHRDFKITMPE